MSFLFGKSKKNQNSALPAATRDTSSSHGPNSMIPTANGSLDSRTRNTMSQTPTPANGSVNNSISSLQAPTSTASPEPKSLRDRTEAEMQAARSTMIGPSRTPGDSPYPWSQRRMAYANNSAPFPRYGASVNATAAKDGSIYIMGGLIGGTTVKGDLWIADASNTSMPCFPAQPTGDGPGPRVGHASLLVGNAYIVFGGDTKQDDGDVLDDTLYLLNTSTKHWSRAIPAGQRPSGRYGHTLNILGSKIYIFGGQVEGFFFNDLIAFDLNALQSTTSGWEVLIRNTRETGAVSQGLAPPARTNHTVVTWNEKLYLFGGTDGVTWFNDVWTYDPRINAWSELDCIGYIPIAREGHAATIVNDTMYIFGGRTREGQDLGDLAAFRISTRRWYMFQNMGPSPTGRSGHSMTAFGRYVVVLGGEPSSQAGDRNELSMSYVLDTSKIRYPASDTPVPTAQNPGQANRKSSAGERTGPQPGKGSVAAARESVMGPPSTRPPEAPINSMPQPGSRLPRVVSQGPPAGPPPAYQPPQPQPRMNGAVQAPNQAQNQLPGQNQNQAPRSKTPTKDNRAVGGIAELGKPAQQENSGPNGMQEPAMQDNSSMAVRPARPYSEAPNNAAKRSIDVPRSNSISSSRAETKSHVTQRSIDSYDTAPRPSTDIPRSMSRDDHRLIDSGVGSSPAMSQQNEELVKELETARSRNAWYASELALARKAGYQPGTSNGQILEDRTADSFDDDDRPLIEALLKMRAELAKVTGSIEDQAVQAANKIAEVEKQRDAAVKEAVYAQAKLAAHGGSGSLTSTPQSDSMRNLETPDNDRVQEMNRRLAQSVAVQGEMAAKIEHLKHDVETERRSKQLAEETADAAEKRVAELESYKQRNGSELETLRDGLHELERVAREESANSAEARATSRMLAVDKHELGVRLTKALEEAKNHSSILNSLRDAVTASSNKASLLERKLEEERSHRAGVERKLAQLKSEHEERTQELEGASRRLRDAEEMAEKHAAEAQTHRQAVLSGLDRAVSNKDDERQAVDERVRILTQQVEAANSMVRQNQKAADGASEKLRRAEERIAGLEAYQEQSSREALSLRKQLKQTVKDTQNAQVEKSELIHQFERHQLESNALEVQLKTLKGLLDERAASAADGRRSRANDSPGPRFGSPEIARVRELEHQLERSMKAHEDVRSTFEQREMAVSKEWEDKLAALTNDHQAAVKYLRGTEKMLTRMKQELERYKSNNNRLEEELQRARSGQPDGHVTSGAPASWESERDTLRKEINSLQTTLESSVSSMENKLASVEYDLKSAQDARDSHVARTTELETAFAKSRAELETARKENAVLNDRAQDAESRVQMFLDQFESSVDNYRRQSQLTITGVEGINGGAAPHSGGAGAGHMHSKDSISGDSIMSAPDDDTTNMTVPGHQSIISNAQSRNSMALDNLASELDALRSHWETTNKAYRLSNQFDFERTPGSDGGELSESLAAWKRKMDAEEEADGKAKAGGVMA